MSDISAPDPQATPVNPGAIALAIDIGSSSVRVMAYTALGESLPAIAVQQQYTPTLTIEGGAEFDPTKLRDAVFACLDHVVTQLTAAKLDVYAVGIDTFATNLFGVDSADQPITPLYLWNDTRSRAYTDPPGVDSMAAYERTGAPFHVSYWLPRLRWLKDTQPDLFGKVTRWLSIGEWLHETLFGVKQVSTSLAAWTGLLNRHTGAWDAELIQASGITTDYLSPISDQPLGTLIDPFAKRWPSILHAIWRPAIADGYAANVGCGTTTPDRASLTIGTSGALRVIVPSVPNNVPHGLFCYKLNADTSLIGGAVSNAGNIFAWLAQTLKLSGDPFDHDTAPGSHGLTVLPYWAGERSPGWHDSAKATITGITLATTPADIGRASLEAVLYQIARIDDLLGQALPRKPDLIAAGGVLAHSPGWAQVTADILGRPVALCADPQTTARGTALLAFGTQSTDPLPAIVTTYPPRVDYTAQHADRRKIQQQFYDRMFGE